MHHLLCQSMNGVKPKDLTNLPVNPLTRQPVNQDMTNLPVNPLTRQPVNQDSR